jgi:hypothetical protein
LAAALGAGLAFAFGAGFLTTLAAGLVFSFNLGVAAALAFFACFFYF